MIKSNTILTILFAFLLGVVPSIWIIQNDLNVQKFIRDKLINSLETGWNAKINFDEFNLNLFTASIYLKKGNIHFLCDKKCSWEFEYARVSLSQIFSLIKKRIYLNFIFDDLQIFVSGKYKELLQEVQKHLTDMFLSIDSEDLDIILSTLRINNLKLKLTWDNKESLFFDFPGRFFGRRIKLSRSADDRWIFSANLYNAKFLSNDNCLIDRLNGFFTLFQSESNGQFNLKFKSDFRLFYDKNSRLFAQGNFKDNKLIADIKSKEGILKYKLNCNLGFAEKNIGKIKLKDFDFRNTFLGDLDLDLFLDDKKLKSSINFYNSNLFSLSGRAEYDFEKFNIGLFFENVEPIFITKNKEFLIDKSRLQLKLNIDDKFYLKSKYFIQVDKKDKKNFFKIKGTLKFNDSVFFVDGKTAYSNYLIKAKFLKQFYITKFRYTKNNVNYIDLNFDQNDKTLSGKVKNYILRFFLPPEYHYLFLIDKKYFNIKLFQNDFNLIRGALIFDDGPFYLPESYNLIERFNSSFLFNVHNKKIIFTDSEIKFYKGRVLCPLAGLQFCDDLKLRAIYAPIKIDNLLVNWGRAFYGFIYGNILIQKNIDERLKINGDLILKKSVLKDNPLSLQADSSLSFFNTIGVNELEFDLDLNLSNEAAVNIETDFLKVKSNFDINIKALQLKNQSLFPKILGSIDLEHGEFLFLKNKLHINKGQIQFMPNRPNDPLINIFAKNKIKKYFINMNISGSLKNHKISLDSTPELTEEQILALLMSGSENASFKTDLPAILMQNLSNWVTERKQTRSKTKNFFQKIAMPFKYIQITPDFTDQSGRGGIRGTISIDINKQLHAQIQKNFNLQEDFAFQVEYFLTDDFNIKAVKDQRGELGSEMELRFKF